MASKGPVIIINQLKSIYNSPLKDSYSHPIRTCFPIIASNETDVLSYYLTHSRVKPLILTALQMYGNRSISFSHYRLVRVHTPGVEVSGHIKLF